MIVEYFCPICHTEGRSMDYTKAICPHCENGPRPERPGLAFRVTSRIREEQRRPVDARA